MKKKVKVKFLGFWKEVEDTDNLFYNILKERYDVEISEDPDFLFFTPLHAPLAFARYDCVRIMYTGEFYSADFTMSDYAIDFDDFTFGDRHMRYPLYLYRKDGPYQKRKKLTYDEAKAILEQKKYFANFIFGHGAVTGKREEVLEAFSKYKRVDCAGRYLNNMPNGEVVTYGGTKGPFVQKSKFTLAIESVCYPDYCGEKITDAFENYSIPVYYGNVNVDKEFNSKAFINLHAYDTVEDALEQVKQIDNDDERYIQMLMEDEFADPDCPQKKYEELKAFLYNIFDQDKEDAYRRTRWYRSYQYERMYKYASYHFNNWFLHGIYCFFNKLDLMRSARKSKKQN